MSHYVKRFGAALSVLAGHGHIKQRLIDAFERHLEDIDADTLPSAAIAAFASLRQRVTQVAPLNGEGPICASVRKMSIEEADQCARRLVEVYAEIIRSDGDAEDALPLPVRNVAKVPPILLKSV